jgi:hypothetical protein
MADANRTDIARWIFASVTKHFDDNKGTLELFLEGQHRDDDNEGSYVELRIDGPFLTELCKDYWRVVVEVNALIHSLIDTDLHRIYKNIGVMTEAFTAIKLYKYGTGPNDDDSQFGCLLLKHDISGSGGDLLSINNFGQIDPTKKLQHATVEGHYETHLTL